MARVVCVSAFVLGLSTCVLAGEQPSTEAPEFLNPAEESSPAPKPGAKERAPLPVTSRETPEQPVPTADVPKPVSSQAAEASKGYHLALEAAIEIAILNNLGLKISRLNDRETDAAYRAAWADYYPIMRTGLNHANATVPRGVADTANGGTNTFDTGITQRSPWGTTLDFALSESRVNLDGKKAIGQAGFTLSQPLWKGFGPDVGYAAIRTARIQRMISRAGLDLDTQRVILNVRQAYNNVISEIQNLAVSRQQVQSQKTFLQLTEARERAGQVTKLDVFNADVQLHQRELDLLTNERALEDTLDTLKQLMDVDLAEKLIVDAPIINFGEQNDANVRYELQSDEKAGVVMLVTVRDGKPAADPKILFHATHYDEGQILKEALDNRLDLFNSRRAMAVQKVQVLLAKNGLGQQIDLVGSFNHNANGHSIFEGGGHADSDQWNVGVNATFPWGKIKDRATFERAVLELEKQEIELKQTRTAVQSTVRSNMRALRVREQSLLVQGRLVENAKRSAEAAQISFDRGLKDSFDVITAQNNLLAAKRDFISSLVQYANDLAQLEVTVGKPTGRVDLSGQSVGGMIDAQIPAEAREKGLPAQAPDPTPSPLDDPKSDISEYRRGYDPSDHKLPVVVEPAPPK
jgi:outer membrane protein TolC